MRMSRHHPEVCQGYVTNGTGLLTLPDESAHFAAAKLRPQNEAWTPEASLYRGQQIRFWPCLAFLSNLLTHILAWRRSAGKAEYQGSLLWSQ